MGTRSNTIVYDDGQPLVNIYRQFDGYPSGHGQELVDFLSGVQMVNGLGFGDPAPVANGAGCLAAQMIAHLKTEPGGIYIAHPDQRDNDYVYEVHADTMSPDKGIRLVVFAYGEQIFDGRVEEFDAVALEDSL